MNLRWFHYKEKKLTGNKIQKANDFDHFDNDQRLVLKNLSKLIITG